MEPPRIVTRTRLCARSCDR